MVANASHDLLIRLELIKTMYEKSRTCTTVLKIHIFVGLGKVLLTYYLFFY